MKRATPLSVFEERPLYLVTSEAFGPVKSWPVQGGSFSVLLCTHGSERPPLDALHELAKDLLDAGAKWAVCAGPWANDMEEAILDAQGEQEQGGVAPGWEDVLVSTVVEGSIAEATWQAWNLFDKEGSPLVAVFTEGDPELNPFKALAQDLKTTFEEVLGDNSDKD